MAFEAKTKILAAIGKTEDVNMKVVLLLLLGVFEEIGAKIDAMRSDEQGLREAVLSGHEPVHHDHHVWVAAKMRAEIDAAKASHDSAIKIRDGLIEKAIWAVLLVAAGIGWLR